MPNIHSESAPKQLERVLGVMFAPPEVHAEEGSQGKKSGG
jgi:hypothetical protein